MTAATETLYRRWRALAEKGYGDTRSPARMTEIDAKIRRARERYETALKREA